MGGGGDWRLLATLESGNLCTYWGGGDTLATVELAHYLCTFVEREWWWRHIRDNGIRSLSLYLWGEGVVVELN